MIIILVTVRCKPINARDFHLHMAICGWYLSIDHAIAVSKPLIEGGVSPVKLGHLQAHRF